MKKIIAMMITGILCCSLCACSGSTQNDKEGHVNEVLQKEHQENENQLIDGLELLCDSESLANCYTKDGYYYLSDDTVELKNGTYGMHLMYMDFATQQEIFLCSNTGCKHDTEDCSAVFLMDEFPYLSCGIFVYRDKLYILSKEMDNEGVVSQNLSVDIGNEMIEAEASPAVLYEMNLDGTNRHKVYTFDAGLTIEDVVLGNRDGLYFITKKLSVSLEKGNSNVTTSSDKRLIFLDVNKQKAKDVCSFDFNDTINWKIIGCFQDALVLRGDDYGKEMTAEDYIMNDEDWKALYENSSDVIAVLDLTTKTLSERYRIDNAKIHSIVVRENMLYVSYSDTGEIKAIDLENKEENVLCSLEQNLIMHTFDDVLCCRSWEMADDFTYYFVNVETGEIYNPSLVNQTLGWSLEFQAEIGSKVLLIYDYEATDYGDGSYEITQYKYALIEKEDLYAGNANYMPIKMIGKGN